MYAVRNEEVALLHLGCKFGSHEAKKKKKDLELGVRIKEWLNFFFWKKKWIFFSWKNISWTRLKLLRVDGSQLSWMSVMWDWTVRDAIQSSSVSRLSNSHMILPDIPSQATWHIAMLSTESLYISLSCYYTFHAEFKCRMSIWMTYVLKIEPSETKF